MSHKVIIEADEYRTLRDLAKLAGLVGDIDEDTDDEFSAEVMDGCRMGSAYHRSKYGDIVPEPYGDVPSPKSFENDDLIARAEATANHLMSLGINGPRLGGWPRAPSNVMCEAAATIRALLAASNKGT